MSIVNEATHTIMVTVLKQVVGLSFFQAVASMQMGSYAKRVCNASLSMLKVVVVGNRSKASSQRHVPTLSYMLQGTTTMY